MGYPNRGRIVVTPQLIHEMLGLPKEVEVIGFDTTPARGTLSVIVRSDEKIPGITYPVAEGQEAPCVDVAMSVYGFDGEIPQAHMVIYERVRNLLIGAVADEEPYQPIHEENVQ